MYVYGFKFFKKGLLNEIKILQEINHPNCLILDSLYSDELGYYLITELLDSKRSLSSELSKFREINFQHRAI